MLRILSVCWMLLVLSRVAAGADSEGDLYTQGAKAFADRFYERAEQQFGEFAVRYPDSTNVASALLLQAQSRFFQRRYEPAIELLRQSAPKAGPLADQFVFWTAEALSESGAFADAGAEYRKLMDSFPESALRMRASYLEAFCVFQTRDYPRVIELLQAPAGAFQTLAALSPADASAIRGHLLLGEALTAAGKVDEARAILSLVAPGPDLPELNWQRHHLLARAEFAGPAPEAALAHLTNAVSEAQSARRPLLEAQSRSLEADVHRKLNRTAEAVAAYEKIGLIEALPIDQKRLALLKNIELLSTLGNITNALARLENYLAAQTNEPAADLLKIKAGELWLERFRQLIPELARAPQPAAAALAQARAHLTAVLTQFTNSTHLARAWLNLGWCHWEEGIALDRPARVQESAAAFRTAAERLGRSVDQALAYFKLGDAHLYLKRPAEARTNYLTVARNYADLPQVKNALLDRVYRQLVRTSADLGDFASAREFLGEFRAAFPNNPLTEETLFFYGQALATQRRAAEAREAFQDFLRNYPGSPLAADVRFAEARTHGAEGDLAAAIKKHEDWLRVFTNHVLRPQVEFRRAALADTSGQRTNALSLFTNFVAQFPGDPLAPAAQTWVADYYFEQEQWPAAEQNYQRVFQNTNWARSPLAYESRLMAAKTAFKRQGYPDARAYLTNLIHALAADAKAPPDLAPRAWFVLGDVFLEEPVTGSTNALHNFIEAAKVFDHIATQYPSNTLAVLALGKKGDCHLQLASSPAYAQSYAEATNAYLAVLQSKLPGVPVSARNQALVGLGLVFKSLAETRAPGEREELQREALERFLDVVYSRDRGGRPDPYFVKVAGLEAGRLAESLGNSSAALQLYRRLLTDAPALKPLWEARITALQQRLAAAGP